ncbi:MAG: beta-lactamase family protein [Bacteroidales bacterium]|jgi:CubicO group peptidase (beta-lactamase class C family)|nr:beta-lactamase family protein [Bacteroidales bacterium]
MKKILKKMSIAIVVIFAGLLVITAFPSYHYLRQALIHLNPDIDDYRFFANRTIKASAPQKWKISHHYNQTKIPENYLPAFAKYKTVAYLVVKDTAILYEQYWDNYSEHSLSNSFSAAKSIVSLLAGIARDEGKIKSFDQPVADFYPPFADDERSQITIRHLLTMSAGLDWEEAYSSPFSITTKAYYGDDIAPLIAGLNLEEKPGVWHRYKSGVTELLAMVITNAVGEPLGDYASRKLWTPIGAEHDALWSLDRKNGLEKAYCCFNSNARDFARLGQLILNKGKWNGTQIISEEYLDEATRAATWLKDEDTGDAVDFYGYQWWRMERHGSEIIYARGLFGQYIFVLPDQNMVIVRLGNLRDDAQTAGHYPLDAETWIDAAFDITGACQK